jgi:2-iminobutanoate/2-iminopropanoate deaminase
MDKAAISTSGASAPVAPYSQAITAGSFIFVAGQVGINPKSGKVVPRGIRAQTGQAIKNLKAVLAAGTGLEHVVKTTVFLRNARDYKTMNEVYGQYFVDRPPARTTVQAIPPVGDFLIELEATACTA